MRRYVGYWDRKKQCFSTDYPPQIEKFGEAPMIKMGTLTPMRHPATGIVCETVQQWDHCDKMAGTHTTGHREVVRPRDTSTEKRADLDQAMEKAIQKLEWGMAPMSEAEKAVHKVRNDAISSQYGIDAHNILGRKQ